MNARLALLLVGLFATPACGQPAHPGHGKSATAAAHAKPVKPSPPAAEPVPAATGAPAGPMKGSSTGLALPRFAALKTDDVDMRVGPGTRYPIEWVYKRRDLPVRIEREFEVWRLVEDQDHIKGWVHQATLTGRRSFLVLGADETMRSGADDTAPAIALLRRGVIGRLRACEAAASWCQVQVGDLRGWLKRAALWGIEPDEAVQ